MNEWESDRGVNGIGNGLVRVLEFRLMGLEGYSEAPAPRLGDD